MGSKEIVVLLKPHRVYHALSKKFHLLKLWEANIPQKQFLEARAWSARAVISGGLAPVTKELIESLPNLGIVVTTSAGVDHIDLAECRRRGVAVANVGTIYSEDAADLAVALLIDVFRRISAADRYVRGGLWSVRGDYPLGTKVSGKRIGIVGLGSIGSEIAKRLEGFGCKISYNSRKKKPSVSFPFYSNVQDLAAENDAIIVCCTLTNETYHLINRDVLLALGKDSVVINVGRGSLIDEKELVSCLMQGEVGGAGLDVFEDEPNVPQELMSMDNVVLSPHQAVFTPESFDSLLQVIEGNLEAFFLNKPLLTPVQI